MLLELSVQNLGVIEASALVLRHGVSVLTGETGAGKTMVVQAIELLTGGRADPSMVRNGAEEASVEGRFEMPGGEEVVLRRVIPADGRSRAYLNGSLARASDLAEIGANLVDLHGQHQHQSLLRQKVQRAALDRHGGIDLDDLHNAKAEERRLLDEIGTMGGDARARQREIDLLQFQVDELNQAELDDPLETDVLADLEELLADAVTHIEHGDRSRLTITADDGVIDLLGQAIGALAGRAPYQAIAERLRGLQAELLDASDEIRRTVDSIDDDPERLATVRSRRQLLIDLLRKYGDTLEDVIAYRAEASDRLTRLRNHEDVAAELETALSQAQQKHAVAARAVAKLRRSAAPVFAGEVNRYLPDLALENASLTVEVRGEDPADDVEIMFRANSGAVEHGLAKVASGGELARVMLSIRLVLTAGPPTLVFDEVDAGVGGAAAIAVGRALGRLGMTHQVLVVTHLPQVAAFANQHLVVDKSDDGRDVVSTVTEVTDDHRVRELARMLAGQPDSKSGREHATELLQQAKLDRSQV
ncbi:MAG: DNA repair protein RecN [Actinomycetota bacterium]|nr:DNA repair protein RecN [Actinomycetota bacterium]